MWGFKINQTGHLLADLSLRLQKLLDIDNPYVSHNPVEKTFTYEPEHRSLQEPELHEFSNTDMEYQAPGGRGCYNCKSLKLHAERCVISLNERRFQPLTLCVRRKLRTCFTPSPCRVFCAKPHR